MPLFLVTIVICAVMVLSVVEASNNDENSAKKVNVELFYEIGDPQTDSLMNMIQNDFFLDEQVSKAVALNFVPFGNTKQNDDGSFSCRYGAAACEVQVAQLCTSKELAGEHPPFWLALHLAALYHCLKTWAPAIIGYIAYCWVSNYSPLPTTSSADSVDHIRKIESCSKTESRSVMIEAMKASEGLSIFPTARVNGVTLNNTASLQETICKSYKGFLAACKNNRTI